MSASIAVNNIGSQIVLRRILQQLVQRVDVLEGRRANGDSTANWRDADRALSAELSSQIQELSVRLQQAMQQLESVGELATIVYNGHARAALMRVNWSSTSMAAATLRYNISASIAKIAVGVWEFVLEQETMYGTNVLEYSVPTLSWSIAPTPWNYNVVYTPVATNKFRLSFFHGGNAVDPDDGDIVYFTLQFKRVDAGLPPV